MKVIVGGRQTGKTTALIRQSAETGFYIVTDSQRSVVRIERQAKSMGLSIPIPLTYDEFIDHDYVGRGIDGLLIDDADRFLERFSYTPIVAVSLNVESLDSLTVFGYQGERHEQADEYVAGRRDAQGPGPGA